MILSPRISTGQLAQLCHRLATSLEAGIDARTVWAREVERARGRGRSRLRAISDGINRGDSLAESARATGNYFPRLFRDLAEVGEQTGHEAEVFAQLADHYQNQVALRRDFLASLAWPLTELVLALGLIGLLIWIMGLIRQMTGNQEIDPLGLGLVGNSGLAVYLGFLAAVGLALFVAVQAVRRGALWVAPVQRLAMRLPVLGPAVHTLALARLAWAMHLTGNTGMDVRRALRLSLGSTGNARLIADIPRVDAEIARGNSIYDAFRAAGGYPNEFLDTLAVGEQSGKLAESMAVLSRQYHDRARVALATLTKLCAVAVWVLIAAVIIAFIFRLAFFYIGIINRAASL